MHIDLYNTSDVHVMLFFCLHLNIHKYLIHNISHSESILNHATNLTVEFSGHIVQSVMWLLQTGRAGFHYRLGHHFYHFQHVQTMSGVEVICNSVLAVSSSGRKQPEVEFDRWAQSSAEARNAWISALNPPSPMLLRSVEVRIKQTSAIVVTQENVFRIENYNLLHRYFYTTAVSAQILS